MSASHSQNLAGMFLHNSVYTYIQQCMAVKSKKSCRRLFLPPCKNIPIHCRPLMRPWFLGRGPQENWQCNRIVHNSWSDMRAALLEHKMWSMLHLSGDYCMYNLFVQSGAAYRSWGFEGEDLESSPGWWAATVATYCPSTPGNSPNSCWQNLTHDGTTKSVHVHQSKCV